MGNNIEALLKPQSVVVIGASAQPGKVGNVILTQVARGKFRVFAVNPKGGTACGLPFYASVRDLPEVPDLAVLALPAAPTMGAAQECIDLGVKAIVAIASGFGETGNAGRLLEQQLADMLRGSQTRLLGPNTLGLLVPESGLDTNFLPADRMRRPDSGNIVLLSQSGSVAIGEIDSNALTGVSISAFVGFGNRLDINENELMDYYAVDAGTDVLAMYLESFADPQGFLERCRRIVPKKPVVLLKAGRSEAGARAVQLHTGSLAGSDRVTDGALRQAGVIRVYDTQELMDAARILSFMPPIYNNRVAVLTNGGGFGIVASDFIESTRPGIGARLAVLSDETKQKISSAALSFAAVRNPIDLTGSLNNAMCDAALSALQEDPGVDIILFTLGFQPPAIDEGLIDIIIHWARHGSKPMVVVPIGSDIVLKAMQKFNAARVPAFTSIWRGVRAIETLARRGNTLRNLQAGQEDAAAPAARQVLPTLQAGVPVAEHEVKAALSEIGVNVPKSIILRPGEPVPNVSLNYPLVVKISAADILHKTEQKGVLLGIRDQAGLEVAVADMRSRFATGEILVEEMEERGVEMIIGLVRDSTFGLAIMCGVGGTTAELYQDVTFRTVPITRRDADEMLSELKGHKLLEGFRGIKTDREGLINLLVKIAQFGEFYQDDILQMDLNPVILQAERAVAVDAKILWAQG